MSATDINSKEGELFAAKRALINTMFPGKINDIKFVKLFRQYRNFDFHDRTLIGNLFTIDIGVGFSGTGSKSGSMIIVDTFLDKFTYKRAKNLLRETDKYMNWLSRQEQQEIKVY